MNLTADEIESLRLILRATYLSDYGSRTADNARSILRKLDTDVGTYIALRVPKKGKRMPKKGKR